MAVLNNARLYLGDVLIGGGMDAPTYEWNQIPELVRQYLENVTYDPNDYTVSHIAEYAPATADKNNTYPIGQTVETSVGTLNRDGYDVAVLDGTTVLYNDIPGKYTGYAVNSNGNVSQVGTLKPTGFLRQIKCETANVRDLGGWACDGGTVKYGKLFRGGEFQAADLDVFLGQMGIRHELNLRGATEAEEARTILRDYVGFTCPEQYVWYTITDTSRDTWKEIIRCVFDCVSKKEPVFFHCSAGADRTGTVACILEAILGMSQSDIDMDYELTSFATGTDTDLRARRRDESEWSGLISQINNTLTVGDTFRDKVIGWIATMGFTADEINAFRAAMIDGTPDTIVLDIDTYAVTSDIGGVESDNTQTEATQYQPYEANIAAPKGYAIGNVKVTMGGTDITATAFKGFLTTLNRAVVKNLTNCALDNPMGVVIDGQGYVANLIVDVGYTFDGGRVSITMGGKDMANYYSEGKIAIPNVTGDIVITAEAVESASETAAVAWLNGNTCTYTVGSACTVSTNASYIISEKIPVEQGKTYTVESLEFPSASAAIKYIGVNDDDVVTEVHEWKLGTADVGSYSWTPSSGTTGLRLRGYSTMAEQLQAVTELTVS